MYQVPMSDTRCGFDSKHKVYVAVYIQRKKRRVPCSQIWGGGGGGSSEWDQYYTIHCPFCRQDGTRRSPCQASGAHRPTKLYLSEV